MYSEKYFKNHILWIRIKRLLFMLIFSIIGCIIGVISSSYIVDILQFDWNLKPLTIAGSTIIFFIISVLVTSNSSRYVQDCLWKIETLHTLNNLSNKLDIIKSLEHNSEELSEYFSEIKKGLIDENKFTESNKIDIINKVIDNKETISSDRIPSSEENQEVTNIEEIPQETEPTTNFKEEIENNIIQNNDTDEKNEQENNQDDNKKVPNHNANNNKNSNSKKKNRKKNKKKGKKK